MIGRLAILCVSGLLSLTLGAAPGFWSLERDADGRWWARDPVGTRTVIRGVDWVIYRGHGCEADGRVFHYREWNDAHYASPADWEAETLSRLRDWGFNVLGAGHDASLRHRGFAHAWDVDFGNVFGKALAADDERWIVPNRCAPCTALPNVFHPDFERFCDARAAKVCTPLKDDRDLFGWFLDNELCWWADGPFHGVSGAYDRCLAKPEGHSARRAAEDFARTHSELSDEALKEAFLGFVADRYFAVTTAAVRRHDPNHLILGCRFAGLDGAAEVVWKVAGRYVDCVTFNSYPTVDLDRMVVTYGGRRITDSFAERYAQVGKPMFITEWGFSALDSGLPCTQGSGQRFRTQRERAAATELCAKTFLSMPFLVGYDFFMWVDEPKNGIAKLFPENTNYGLVSEKGVPYPEVTSAFRRLHADVVRWHASPPPPARRFNLSLDSSVGPGDVLSAVRLNGVSRGKFRVALIVRTGLTTRWLTADRVERVTRDGRVTRVVASGRDQTASYVVDVSFERTEAPGAFEARVTAIENCGQSDFVFEGLVLEPLADFVNGLDDAPAGDLGVPNLWGRPLASVWRAPDGREYGAATLSPLCEKLAFYWHTGERRQRPDIIFRPYEPAMFRPSERLVLPPHYWARCHVR